MSQAERNVVVVFGGRALAALVSIIYVVLIPRFLGPENYGYYAFWFAQLFLLFSLFDLGSTELLRRYLPAMLVERSGQVISLIGSVLRVKLMLIPFVFLLVLGYEHKLTFTFIFIASIMATCAWIFSDFHFAANNMVRYSLWHLLRKIIRLVFLLVLFWLFAEPGIIAALVATEFFILVLYVFLTRKEVPGKREPLKLPFRHYFLFGFGVYVATLLYFATGRLPVIIAKAEHLSFAEIGYIALAIDVCYFALRELFYGISESLQPIQVIKYAERNNEKLAQSFRLTITYTLVFMLPSLSFLIVFLEPVLTIISPKFLPAAPYFLWFFPVVVFNVLAYIYRQILIVREKKGLIVHANLWSFLVFLAMVYYPEERTLITLASGVTLASAAHLVLMRIFARPWLRVRDEIPQYAKLLSAAALFHLVLSYTAGQTHVILTLGIIAAPALYLGALFLLRIFGKAEVNLARRMLAGLRMR